MSTETQATEEDVRERIRLFMMRNFPQIQMHGGSAAIQDLDLENGEVSISLGGACSGCGISPMTVQALKHRLVAEIPEINAVHAYTGMDSAPSMPSFSGQDDDENRPQAPF
jgi:Fe-S cluster biogenesis protein NfuA